VTLLDTHVWLWWITGDPRLSDAAHAAIVGDPDRCVATISIWEVTTLERRGRLRLLPDRRTWVARALGGSGVTAIALSPGIAATAGALPDTFPGDPADRIVYATALERGHQLVTKDRRMRRHDPVRVVW
jgi:PIN domain nuclease of toxin-antitoxin system